LELRHRALANLEGLIMKVLVTGSQGYIGTVLVPMLQYHEHEVVGIDTDLYQKCTFTGKLPDIKTIKYTWPGCQTIPSEIMSLS